MADINTFRNADEVFMPTILFHVASALWQYRILLHMLLKSTHPLIMEFDCFYTPWTQEEGDMDELREATRPTLRLSSSASSSSAWLIGSLSSLALAAPTWTHRTSWNSFRRSSFRSSGPQVFPAQYLPRPSPTL
jgi:hypothetical protein